MIQHEGLFRETYNAEIQSRWKEVMTTQIKKKGRVSGWTNARKHLAGQLQQNLEVSET
jgi:hypothetical protein